ncbi:hypothetical protein BD779DRAFT_1784869 [Infundibulicybe gibba]|nr:hypothetical protein BD779DRAFT_1784869 [Infundibulicybe gibba]
MSQPKLFQPIQLGHLALQHRVVLAPLTRFKSGRTDHVPTVPLMKDTTPSVQAPPDPAYQLLHIPPALGLGRAANPEILAAEDPSFPHISASNLKLSTSPASEPAPRALTLSEIDEYVALYAQAARNAIAAGFDGVEIHGANGYLVDQFLQDVSNVRDDEYGGSIENRSRTGIRLSPWTSIQGTSPSLSLDLDPANHTAADMGMPTPSRSSPTSSPHSHAHTRISRTSTRRATRFSAGGYDRATALAAAEEEGDALVAFGRHYIANPDLPKRLKKDIPLTPYNRKTFYTPIDEPGAAHGYVDYPFAEEGARL